MVIDFQSEAFVGGADECLTKPYGAFTDGGLLQALGMRFGEGDEVFELIGSFEDGCKGQ